MPRNYFNLLPLSVHAYITSPMSDEEYWIKSRKAAGLPDPVKPVWGGEVADARVPENLRKHSAEYYKQFEKDRKEKKKLEEKILLPLSGAVATGLGLTFAPTLTSGLILGELGGRTVDEATKKLTGKDFATYVSEKTGMSPVQASFVNPGYTLAGAYKLAPKIASGLLALLNAKNNIVKRGIEGIMRQSSAPVPNVKLYLQLLAKDKDARRYILTGKLGDRDPVDIFGPYLGLIDLYDYGKIPYNRDLISAVLYKTPLDEDIATSSKDFGALKEYINKYYPDKKAEIPVYEIKHSIAGLLPINKLQSKRITNTMTGLYIWPDNQAWVGDFLTNNLPLQINVGGYTTNWGMLDGKLVAQGVDIYKFLPAQYTHKWINSSTNIPKWKLPIYKFLTGIVNKHTTPIVTKTLWGIVPTNLENPVLTKTVNAGKPEYKYTAKLAEESGPSKTINILDKQKNKVGYIKFKTDGNEVLVDHLKKDKAFPEHENFQLIATEALRLYSLKYLGKSHITGLVYTKAPSQVSAVSEGFSLKPTNIPMLYEVDVNPQALDLLAVSNVIRRVLNRELRPDLAEGELSALRKIIASTPLESLPTHIRITSIPELYDTQGVLQTKKFNQLFPEESDNAYMSIITPSKHIPGFWASQVQKPLKNFGVKFELKLGGKLNYLNLFK